MHTHEDMVVSDETRRQSMACMQGRGGSNGIQWLEQPLTEAEQSKREAKIQADTIHPHILPRDYPRSGPWHDLKLLPVPDSTGMQVFAKLMHPQSASADTMMRVQCDWCCTYSC